MGPVLSAESGFHLAFITVNRSTRTRLKWDSNCFPTLCTDHRERLLIGVDVSICTYLSRAIGFSSPTAGGTGQGIIGIALGTAAFLIFNGEVEVLFTIVTMKYFLCEAHLMTS